MDMIDSIQWLGQGSFAIQGTPLIYINPWRITRSTFHADVILVSHDHYDACSQADIRKLRGTDTRLFSNEKVSKELERVEILRLWQSVQVDRAGIKAVPAYSPSSMQHPQSDGGLGFVISLNYYDIYYAGDTELIPEMDRIRPDIALLPIDGNGTLTVEAALEVVKQIRPRYVIPFNWGTGTELRAKSFKDMVGGRAEVILMTPGG
jgi:L-ascorbate metabolism protein UlaG (beta-lactamase superfamily)